MASIGKKIEHNSDFNLPALDKNDVTNAQKIKKLLGVAPDEKAQKELDEFLQKFKFLGANPNGTEGIFEGQSGRYQIGGGRIGIDSPLPNNDPKRIESLIEMAAIARKSFKPGTEIDVGGGTEESRMVSEKITQMAGLKVHVDEKSLKDVNPALDKLINDTYDKVREKYGLPPREGAEQKASLESAPAKTAEMQTKAPAALVAAP